MQRGMVQEAARGEGAVESRRPETIILTCLAETS